MLNNFFSSVFTKENLETLPEVTDKEVLSDLEDIVISESEVLKLLKELDASKAMGPDNINPFLIKSMAEVFVKPMPTINIDFSKICIIWYCPCCMEGGEDHTDF